MYKFIKFAHPTHKEMSHVASIYEDLNTHKYYLSYTSPTSEIDFSVNQYMLLDKNPTIPEHPILNNIHHIIGEVTQLDIKLKATKHGYYL